MARESFAEEMERRMEAIKVDMDAHIQDWAKESGIDLPELRPTGIKELFDGKQ